MSGLVSVIVPVYNGMRFLGVALDSIAAQDYAPLEVIVVDDGSSDGSADFARARGVTVVTQTRRGVAAARNTGADRATGEILAFLDQDDVWFPAKIRRQVEALNARPGHISLVWQELFLEAGVAKPDWFARPDFFNAPQPGWAPSCMAFERNTFRRVGRFDERLAQASDLDWFGRAKELGIAIEVLPELLVRRRIHDANDSGSPTAFGEIFTVLRGALRRRRAPSLSVVIPAYNTERYIAEALESVLRQVPSDAEVLVVDDGSTDATAAIADRFAPRVRVLREAHRGIAGAFNRGMTEARGEIVASIDADDRWLPQKLDRQMAAMAQDPSIDIVFGHVRQFASPDIDHARFLVPDQPAPGIARGVMLLRRAAWDRVGPMDEHLRAGEFVSWYARAADAGLVAHVLPEVVYERRIHGCNTVLQHREQAHHDYLRVVKATLDRRRSARNA